MAGARRRQAITVIDDILAEGSAFDFYQAIRLLDRLTPASVCRPPVNMPAAEEKPRRQAKTVRRQKKTVSRGAGDAAGKLSSIRIRPELNLDYPQADIVAINALDDGGYEILTTFMGLYGVSSPLPGFITEELLDDEWDEQNAAREFIDILHYHLYPLLYQAWLKYRFSLNAIEKDDARYREIIYCLMGLGEAFRDDENFTGSLLKYAGIFTQQTRSLLGLKTILSDYLQGLDVDIEPCIEQQVEIYPKQRCYLGQSSTTLGEDALIGRQVSDRSGRYRIRIGPLDREQYRVMQQDNDCIRQMRKIIKHYLVQPLDYEIELVLDKGAVQPVQLGNAEQGRLGENTWMMASGNSEPATVRYNQ